MDRSKLNLSARYTKESSVTQTSDGFKLSIPASDSLEYCLAQLDDYAKVKRWNFPARPPLSLSLLARASSGSIPGTWGFGVWNDPFGLSLGFGGNPFRLPALPNAAWFFHASKENYLSFKESRASTATGLDTGRDDPAPTRPVKREAVNGFLAQTFRAPKFDPLLIGAGLSLPFSRKTTRRMLGKVIDEDGIILSVDPTQWHRYKFDWRETRVIFEVDDVQVFESHVSPHPPLGLVIWIDNQYAAFTPEGKIGFGVLKNPEPAWLEIKEIDLK